MAPPPRPPPPPPDWATPRMADQGRGRDHERSRVETAPDWATPRMSDQGRDHERSRVQPSPPDWARMSDHGRDHERSRVQPGPGDWARMSDHERSRVQPSPGGDASHPHLHTRMRDIYSSVMGRQLDLDHRSVSDVSPHTRRPPGGASSHAQLDAASQPQTGATSRTLLGAAPAGSLTLDADGMVPPIRACSPPRPRLSGSRSANSIYSAGAPAAYTSTASPRTPAAYGAPAAYARTNKASSPPSDNGDSSRSAIDVCNTTPPRALSPPREHACRALSPPREHTHRALSLPREHAHRQSNTSPRALSPPREHARRLPSMAMQRADFPSDTDDMSSSSLPSSASSSSSSSSSRSSVFAAAAAAANDASAFAAGGNVGHTLAFNFITAQAQRRGVLPSTKSTRAHVLAASVAAAQHMPSDRPPGGVFSGGVGLQGPSSFANLSDAEVLRLIQEAAAEGDAAQSSFRSSERHVRRDDALFGDDDGTHRPMHGVYDDQAASSSPSVASWGTPRDFQATGSANSSSSSSRAAASSRRSAPRHFTFRDAPADIDRKPLAAVAPSPSLAQSMGIDESPPSVRTPSVGDPMPSARTPTSSSSSSSSSRPVALPKVEPPPSRLSDALMSPPFHSSLPTLSSRNADSSYSRRSPRSRTLVHSSSSMSTGYDLSTSSSSRSFFSSAPDRSPSPASIPLERLNQLSRDELVEIATKLQQHSRELREKLTQQQPYGDTRDRRASSSSSSRGAGGSNNSSAMVDDEHEHPGGGGGGGSFSPSVSSGTPRASSRARSSSSASISGSDAPSGAGAGSGSAAPSPSATPSSSSSSGSSSRTTKGGVRKRIKRVCQNCFFAKSACDEERPCSRCKRLRKEDTCVDRPLQQRANYGTRSQVGSAVVPFLETSHLADFGLSMDALKVFDLSAVYPVEDLNAHKRLMRDATIVAYQKSGKLLAQFPTRAKMCVRAHTDFLGISNSSMEVDLLVQLKKLCGLHPETVIPSNTSKYMKFTNMPDDTASRFPSRIRKDMNSRCGISRVQLYLDHSGQQIRLFDYNNRLREMLGLSKAQMIQDYVNARSRFFHPDDWADILSDSITLFARPFPRSQLEQLSPSVASSAADLNLASAAAAGADEAASSSGKGGNPSIVRIHRMLTKSGRSVPVIFIRYKGRNVQGRETFSSIYVPIKV